MPAERHVAIRRAASRFTTSGGGRLSRHAFSFGDHYDAANTHHGLLVAHNELTLSPGAGFDRHPHRDVEIVTWVLSGSLVHEDSAGNRGIIQPGWVQRLSAGRGVVHAETNEGWRWDRSTPPDEAVHFVQMWMRPDEDGGPPAYDQREVTQDLAAGGLVPVVSGLAGHAHHAAISLRSKRAGLLAAHLQAGQQVSVPDARHVHVYVARGAIELEGAGSLDAGDAAQLTDAGSRAVATSEGAELLVWEMHA